MRNPVLSLCAPCDMPLETLISESVCVGITCWIEGDSIRVKGPKSAAGFGAEIVTRKTEVMDLLRTWSLEAALALMHATDGVIEKLGIDASASPRIHEAAIRCVVAQGAKRMDRLIEACREIVEHARGLAERRDVTQAADVHCKVTTVTSDTPL